MDAQDRYILRTFGDTCPTGRFSVYDDDKVKADRDKCDWLKIILSLRFWYFYIQRAVWGLVVQNIMD